MTTTLLRSDLSILLLVARCCVAASVGIPRQLVVTSDPATVPDLVAGVGLRLPLGKCRLIAFVEHRKGWSLSLPKVGHYLIHLGRSLPVPLAGSVLLLG